jgi:outer membrane cobalamin receptor
VSAGVSFAPFPWSKAQAALLGDAEEGERGRLGAEASFWWRGVLPGHLRAGRFREERTVRQWIAGDADPGIVRTAEAGIGFAFLPLRPKVRWFRREGDGVDHLVSVDSHLESFVRIDERTDGLEASIEGRAGAIEWEGSYAWIRAREKGKSDPLPYHSDHLVRGRVSYERPIPRFPAVPRMDVLGEWRSDRRAPGRSEPMEDYFTLRGRITLNVRGTDLFVQMEQVLGHQVEYLDGPLEGTDGVLSGSRQIYLGLVWPFMDG